MRVIRTVILAISVYGAVLAQTSPARPEFEVASIKPSAAPIGQVKVGVQIDGTQVHFSYLSLKDYIQMAYRVKGYQVVGPDRAMLIRSAIGAGVALPPEALRALDGVSDNSLFGSMQALGLKLEQRKAPLEVLLIDYVEKTPTAN